jgi:CBS domain-containing protein
LALVYSLEESYNKRKRKEDIMPDLSLNKKAQRLRIYIGESDRWRGKSLESALLETLRAQGMAGATVFRGVAGFGAHSRIRTTAIEVLSFDLPVVIETIDSPEKINRVLEILYPMVREGLIILEDVQIIKYAHRYMNPLPADRFVSEVMTRPVVTIDPDTTIYQAWKQMLEENIKALPVTNAAGNVVGIVTNEDLLERAGLQQRLSVAIRLNEEEREQELRALQNTSKKIADVMTHPVITASASEPLGVATARMVKSGLKRLPVVDDQNRLVGILSRLDILRQVAQSETEPPYEEALHPRAVRLVQDVMTSKIPMVSQDEGLPAIVEKFASSGSNRLIVVDSEGKAAGLISDSDIVARVQPAKRRNIIDALRHIGAPPPGKETAYDLMSPGLLTAPPDLPIVEAAKMMLAQSRKWLVVIDADGKPLGLVDRRILLESVSGLFQ